jgi:XTP/dITP diphosphohydrolase
MRGETIVVPGEVEGSRCETFKITSSGSLDFARDDDEFQRVKLLLATRNPHKTREFAQLLGHDFNVRDLALEPQVPEIVESGTTFEENATLKAVAVSRIFPDEIVMADDSGLEVAALNGAPGIFSARYAAEQSDDRRNVDKLLRELRDVRDRSARFRCVIVLAKNGEVLATVPGEVTGAIAESPRGEHGFGYDPIFVPEGFSETFAELKLETKNTISHRANAARKLTRYLRVF